MKLIVTGGLGHIGSELIHQLTKDKQIKEIVIVDSLISQRYVSLFNLKSNSKVRFIPTSISEIKRSEIEVFKNSNFAIHLAAKTDAANSFDEPSALIKNNLGSTEKMIEICGENEIKLIFPSSTSVYGSQELEVNETCKELKPQSPYAECKLMEEALINDAFKAGLRSITMRLGTIHGVSTGMRFHTAINKFCFDHAIGNSIKIWTTAYDQYRPYLALSDACLAIKHIISKDLCDGQIYNLVTENFTIKEILEIIKSLSHKKISTEFVDSRIMNQLSYKVSNEKFVNTGFEFSGSLSIDISKTLELFAGITNE
jgi:UDP-glucose 4-epimerase